MRTLPFQYSARNAGRAPGRLAMTVAGAALVSFLVTAATALVGGMQRSLVSAANPRNVILLGAGSEESLERSEIGPQVASVVAASVPGLASLAGQTLVSPEAVMALPVRIGGEDAPERNGMIRGITPAAFMVHTGVRLVAGRLPGPGEMLVGPRSAEHLGAAARDLEPGRTVMVDRTPFVVSGRFEAPGTVMEPELWAPLADVLLAAKRTTISCVVVALDEGPEAAEQADLEAFAQRRLDLELSVVSETEYLGGLSRFLGPVRWMVLLTAGLVGLGAVLGGLNTLHAAFLSRTREIGTLRAIGFNRAAILISFLQESILLTGSGSLLAVAAAWLLLSGVGVAFSMGTFAFLVDARAVATGLLAGLVLGVVGAAVPAITCLRTPIPQALRAT